jgi:hypothetical protein
MKRRDLLKSCLVVLFAGLSSAVKGKNTPIIESETGVKKDETVDETPDGIFLEGDEMQCFLCGRIIKLEKGYFRLGDRIECECGNRAKFVMNVKLAMKVII